MLLLIVLRASRGAPARKWFFYGPSTFAQHIVVVLPSTWFDVRIGCVATYFQQARRRRAIDCAPSCHRYHDL
jgi:hypothetical protein